MIKEEGRETADERGGASDVRRLPSTRRVGGSSREAVLRLAPVALAGVLLGLFLARFWYELDPVGFAPFGDWPATIALAVIGASFLAAQWWLALRHLLPPDAAFSLHAPFVLLLVYIAWPEVDLRLAATLLLASAGLAVALGVRAFLTSTVFSANERAGERGAKRRAGVVPLALALVVFGLYLRTLGTHVGTADTFEFQVVAPALGVAHPTGYPLYVVVGKLFSLLPIGSLAFRVNLTSAVFATAAALGVYALAASLSGRRLIAFIAALSFAVSGVMWSQAAVAEVYALNALIAALVLGRVIGLASLRPSASSGVPLLFFLFGLGISHHLTTVLLLPALALAIAIARPRLPLRAALLSLGLFLLGLSAWLYIPLRWPALNGAPMPLAQFLDWITGSRFGGALVLSAWRDPARWEIVLRFLLDAYGPAGAALAGIGAVGLALRHWRPALILFVTFAAYVFYGLVYLVPDVSAFLIPAYLVMAIWIGAGVAFLVDGLPAQLPATIRPPLHALSSILFLLVPVTLIWRNFPLVDQRGKGGQAEAWGRYVLGLPIPVGAAILVDSEKIAPLYYLQVTENLRPDLDILVLGTEEEYRRELDTRLAHGQPVYLARFLPNLPYAMRSLGPLVEISSRPAGESARPVNSMLATFGDLIELVTSSTILPSREADPVRVTLAWQALTDSRPNYHVRLRLIDAQRRVWWEDRGAHPVGGFYPTGAWAKGEVVEDYHEIDFDPATPPGAYTLEVGLFTPFGDDGLPVSANGDVWRGVTDLHVLAAAAPPLDRALRQVYGGQIAVTGIQPPGVLPRSSEGQVRLNWARAGEAGDKVVRASLSLVGADGQIAWSGAFEPYGSALRVKDWPLAPLQALMKLPAPNRDGSYSLRLGFVDESGQSLAAKCGWLAPVLQDCPVGTVQVAGEAIGDAVNFDNQVLLVEWSLERAEMRPGESLNVRLTWRGLKAWPADYTVTVQLIGPDGRLHGQVDAWPVQGTLPTTAWAVGQDVADSYSVVLQPDAPGGRYQVVVGWYLLATLRRLPVLDPNGQPVDDRFILGELNVP